MNKNIYNIKNNSYFDLFERNYHERTLCPKLIQKTIWLCLQKLYTI